MTGSWDYPATGGSRPSVRQPVVFDGFGGPEPWGRWTTSPTATLIFGRPLPARFTAVVRGHAFGPNVGAPVRICVGRSCATATFGEAAAEVRVSLRGHGSRRLTFHVPHPTAPGGGDSRSLGIGLGGVRIEEAR